MFRRCALIALACLAVLALVACVRQTPLRQQSDSRRVYKKQNPARLAPRVRPVYRVSDEGPAEPRREQQPDLAVPEVKDARGVAEIDPAAARRLVELLLSRGRELDALDEARAARQRFPRDLELALLQARIWMHLGDSREALESALEAVRLDPYRSHAWVAVADAELARGLRRAAAEAFLAAIRLGAGDLDVLQRAGLQFLEMEWWLEARDSLSAAWEQGDRSPETVRGLAAAWLALDREADALEVLSAAYAPAEAWTRLGKLWMASERWEKAHDSLFRALTLQPDAAEARVLLQMVDSHLPPPTVVKIPAFSGHSRARIQLPAWTAEEEPTPVLVAGIEAEMGRAERGLPALRSDHRKLPALETAGLILPRSIQPDTATARMEAEADTSLGILGEAASLRNEAGLPAEVRWPISLSGLLERLHVTDRLPPLVREALNGEIATGRRQWGRDAQQATRPEHPGGERIWLGWGSEPRAVAALSQLSGRTVHPPTRFRMLGLEPAFGPGSLNRNDAAEFPAVLAVAGLALVVGMSLSSRLGGTANRVVGAGMGLLAGSLAVLAMGIWHAV